MIFVPVILFLVAGLLMVLLFIGDIRELKSILPENHAFHKITKDDTILFYELKKKSVTDPEGLLNQSYLESLTTRLVEMRGALLIRQNGKVVYTSTAKIADLSDKLPDFGHAEFRNEIQQIDEKTFSVKQHDFYMKNGDEISLFVLRDASPLVKFAHQFSAALFAILIILLILTNGILTYYVSKSIIKPIEKLRDAVDRIKNGKLDQSLTIKKQDEIGQLAQSFEEMRVQLKESFDVSAQYEENRKELLAHITHDLKTPITAIKGYVEGIRDGIADTQEKQDRYIQTIYAKAVNLDHLIDELFLYSKLDLKKLPFHFEKINLLSYLTDFVEELEFELEKENTELIFEWNKTASYEVRADREKLKRVLSNIIDNSLKYMDKSRKKITISLGGDGETVQVSITDNGPGIPHKSLPHVFERFFRAEQSRNIQTGGSGLGLAIARMILEEHQGTIQATSTPGEGTTISFTLKVDDKP
ncbi:cell wall metabolism sensor histidine kinase WalK [Bacillus sp. UNCCL13]|nr:HAMP domain-containing sensor histidine kinase [Bacillus sp. UNCCL13]